MNVQEYYSETKEQIGIKSANLSKHIQGLVKEYEDMKDLATDVINEREGLSEEQEKGIALDDMLIEIDNALTEFKPYYDQFRG